MKKLDLKTHDLIADNLEGLKELFPEAFAEGKIDFDALRLLLGDNVEKEKERFGLSWPGKQDAIKMALVQNTGTLRPKKEESKDWDTTGNLFIEGDNLEVLRVLLETYRGKVKMIYIDPPYNTGNDFVYKDDFADNVTSYKEKADENMKSNAATAGRYHSNWLSMMYPRLKLAKELLKDEGVIFVSIDDNEVHHLKDAMNEIFGEENFIAQIIWEKKYTTSNNIEGISATHEYVLVYAERIDMLGQAIKRFKFSEEARARYSNPDNDPRGDWRDSSYHGPKSPLERPNLSYPIINPFTGEEILPKEKSWAFEKSVYDQHVKEKKLWWGKNNSYREPRVKVFLSEVEGGIVPRTLWDYESFGTTSVGRSDLREVFGLGETGAIFDNPKPVLLIEKMVELATDGGDLVLDFFAGSGTTAHAVMQLNASDEGARKFILVQIAEPTPEGGDARKAGYTTIAGITKERIRRAGEKVKTDFAEKLASRESLFDIGFKVFALDTSNLSQWDEKTNDLQGNLLQHIQGVKVDRTQDDLLYEILLKYGIDLTTPIVTETINGKRIYNVGEGYLLVCLEEGVDLKTIEIIAAKKPTRVVFLDKSFKDDIVKLNAEQTLKKAGVEDLRVL